MSAGWDLVPGTREGASLREAKAADWAAAKRASQSVMSMNSVAIAFASHLMVSVTVSS